MAPHLANVLQAAAVGITLAGAAGFAIALRIACGSALQREVEEEERTRR